MADLTSKRYLGEEGIKQIGKNIKGGNELSGSTGYTVTDSVEYPIVGLKVFGKSEQKQYSGKNLFPWNDYTKSPLFVWSVDGSVTANFKTQEFQFTLTNSSNGGLVLEIPYFNQILSPHNGQYVTVSWEVKSDNDDLNENYENGQMAGGWQGGYIRYKPTTEWKEYSNTFKIDINNEANRLTWYGMSNSQTTVYIRNIQIELGSTATAYEPYVGGIPSPNPDYSQEITSVVEPTVTVCGKNLFSIDTLLDYKDVVTDMGNGYLKFETSENRAYPQCKVINFEGVKNYSLRIEMNIEEGIEVYFGDSTSPYRYRTSISRVLNNREFKDYITVLVVVFKDNPRNVRITINEGETVGDYEPYIGNTLSLPDTLNAIPVSSGGNVTIDGQEYIADYVDFERGVKVQRVVGFDIANGTWKEGASGHYTYYVGSNRYPFSEDLYWICDKLVATNGVNNFSDAVEGIYTDDDMITIGGSYDRFNLRVKRQTGLTSDQINEMLGDSCIIYGIAKTPIETPLSEAELQTYRQLQTYNGVTNISNDKGAGLSVEYCTSKMLAEYALPLIKDLEAENAKKDEEISALKTDILTSEKIHNRIYEGVNLAEKFASEIAAEPYNGDVWAWIKARITAENFTGIRVGDYIPFTTTNGVTLNAQIAGINTYKNYSDTPVGAHIDFICKELWSTLHSVNRVNYNNGTESQNHPWLASDLYLYLNSLSGSVPNGTAVNPETVEADYTADGVYYYLPDELKAVIKEKRFLLPKRYSASGLLTDDNQWGWANIGKLWLPDECEVYGTPIWGGKGFSAGGSGLQYPLFAGNMNRLKFRNGSRSRWWLLSPYSGNSSHWCLVAYTGDCAYYNASDGYIAAPVCFRI